MRNRDGRYNLMFEEWVTEGPFIISPRITFEVTMTFLPPSSPYPRQLKSCFMLVKYQISFWTISSPISMI